MNPMEWKEEHTEIVGPVIDMQEARNAMKFRSIEPKMGGVARIIKVPAVPLPSTEAVCFFVSVYAFRTSTMSFM